MPKLSEQDKLIKIERYALLRAQGVSKKDSYLTVAPHLGPDHPNITGLASQFEKNNPEVSALIEKHLDAASDIAVAKTAIGQERVLRYIVRNNKRLQEIDTVPALAAANKGWTEIGKTLGMFEHGNRDKDSNRLTEATTIEEKDSILLEAAAVVEEAKERQKLAQEREELKKTAAADVKNRN